MKTKKMIIGVFSNLKLVSTRNQTKTCSSPKRKRTNVWCLGFLRVKYVVLKILMVSELRPKGT